MFIHEDARKGVQVELRTKTIFITTTYESREEMLMVGQTVCDATVAVLFSVTAPHHSPHFVNVAFPQTALVMNVGVGESRF